MHLVRLSTRKRRNMSWVDQAISRYKFPRTYAFLDGFFDGLSNAAPDPHSLVPSNVRAYHEGFEMGARQNMQEWEDYILETCDTVKDVSER